MGGYCYLSRIVGTRLERTKYRTSNDEEGIDKNKGPTAKGKQADEQGSFGQIT